MSEPCSGSQNLRVPANTISLQKIKQLDQEWSLALQYVLQFLWMLNVQKKIIALWIGISRGKYFHTADIIPYSVMFNSLFISIFQWKNPTINFRVLFITKK